ncbi:hypothetical protein HGRIS_001544 [Hohenbuehelia grisea]|uniref:Uncharacterized protein n=1 Tax=Hohenbuehelia grisea TaxID=104357 RepID=A0ABR3JQY8_9AGAR
MTDPTSKPHKKARISEAYVLQEETVDEANIDTQIEGLQRAILLIKKMGRKRKPEHNARQKRLEGLLEECLRLKDPPQGPVESDAEPDHNVSRGSPSPIQVDDPSILLKEFLEDLPALRVQTYTLAYKQHMHELRIQAGVAAKETTKTLFAAWDKLQQFAEKHELAGKLTDLKWPSRKTHNVPPHPDECFALWKWLERHGLAQADTATPVDGSKDNSSCENKVIKLYDAKHEVYYKHSADVLYKVAMGKLHGYGHTIENGSFALGDVDKPQLGTQVYNLPCRREWKVPTQEGRYTSGMVKATC